MSDIHNYDDIYDLPHHVSPKRRQMPIIDRAAQFAPFAALTGYEDAVKETARRTDRKIELSDGELAELDRKVKILRDNLGKKPEIGITYFKPDERKSGGEYVTVTAVVRKINVYARTIVTDDGGVIPLDMIHDFSGEIFNLADYE